MLGLIDLILDLLYMVVIADFILSWVMPNPEEFPRKLTIQVTDPLYAPIRAVLNPQKMGGLDLSPMILLILLGVMRRMIAGG